MINTSRWEVIISCYFLLEVYYIIWYNIKKRRIRQNLDGIIRTFQKQEVRQTPTSSYLFFIFRGYLLEKEVFVAFPVSPPPDPKRKWWDVYWALVLFLFTHVGPLAFLGPLCQNHLLKLCSVVITHQFLSWVWLAWIGKTKRILV